MDSQSRFPVYVALLFALLCLLHGDKSQKCFTCVSTCFNIKDGRSNLHVNKLNKDSCNECSTLNDLSFEKQNCDASKCFSALAMFRKKTEDGLILTINFTQRGCIHTCPRKVCDLSNLYSCGFNKKVTDGISSRISSVNDKINKQFKVVKSYWNDMGQGGELHCCAGSFCNNHVTTVYAHKNIRDEL